MNTQSIMFLERRVRALSPVVHSITNYVVMNFTANVLLAAGAAPIMAHAPEEIDELGALSSALVLNIGTLDTRWVHSMHRALDGALLRGIPVAIDPVGAGATSFRTETALELAAAAAPGGMLMIRGNASEIMALAGLKSDTRGVESSRGSEDALIAAAELAQRYNAVVAVSGIEDLVTDGVQLFIVHGGDRLMTRVTGMGCSATALVAAFCAAAAPLKVDLLEQLGVFDSERSADALNSPEKGGGSAATAAPHFVRRNLLAGVTAAAAIMKAAGRAAAQGSIGPGSFVPCFLDMLHEESALEAALNTHVRVAACCMC